MYAFIILQLFCIVKLYPVNRIRYYSAFRLHSNKSMHTDCKNRTLARGCLGIALQMPGNTSRDSGGLNCYQDSA
ncbi:hypothetical protein E5259_20885 [Blautia producta]|uniref:Uncharacterized protein n=1 Tax=Blautia producta TaxID=33035 RepID=A0A7G5MZ12_9FIRM|nr:hypothetical protein E5259_20885 [Blautia producta]